MLFIFHFSILDVTMIFILKFHCGTFYLVYTYFTLDKKYKYKKISKYKKKEVEIVGNFYIEEI